MVQNNAVFQPYINIYKQYTGLILHKNPVKKLDSAQTYQDPSTYIWFCTSFSLYSQWISETELSLTTLIYKQWHLSKEPKIQT